MDKGSQENQEMETGCPHNEILDVLFRAFARIRGKPMPAAPTLDERLDLAAEHLQMLIDYKGEIISVKEMRRHISAYLKGLPHAAEFRGRFHKLDTQKQFLALLAEYRQSAHKRVDFLVLSQPSLILLICQFQIFS